MSKYYSYSVKDELIKYFPGDTITEMRNHKEERGEKDFDHMVILAWAYADTHALGFFLSNHFLKDTILCDDYIVYIVQTKTKTYAYLSFLHFEDSIPFDVEPRYAYDICSEWNAKGYDAVIMRNCIGIEKRNDGTFRFVTHCYNEAGTDFLRPIKVNDEYIFIRNTEPFWPHAEALFYSAVTSGLMSEYESLFKENVIIARCPFRCEYDVANNIYEKAETIVSGINNIKDYFDDRQLPFMAYIKGSKSSYYDIRLVSEDKNYVLFVDYSNQISKVVEETIKPTDKVIPIPSEQIPSALLMPTITAVRSLDIETMHAYAIQLTYSDGCVKNYYLHNIDTKEIPETVVVDGFEFDRAVLQSIQYVNDHYREGVHFSNGYYIPAHILYYRGVAQLVPDKIDKVVFENNTLTLTGLYRVPLKVRRGGFRETSVPRDDAHYGVNAALLDADGNRLSDYSGYYIDRDAERTQLFATQSESSCKIGYLKKDGTWLIPPIFDEGEDFEYDHCITAKIGKKQFLVNIRGEMIPFDYDIRTDFFSEGLCEFSVKKHEGDITYPEEDYFDELSAGLWGFIDKFGKVVIEPQYVFTSGFRHIENRAFVAKIVDGETLWGLIDEKGNEVLPCIYPNLATHSGTAVNFQREKYGKYGIMDFDGNILMDSRYELIKEYNSEHGLIAAGNDWNKCGVARISDGKVIIPFEYEYIGFEKGYIECESPYGGTYCYDYDGNKMPSDFNNHFWEHNGRFCMWKDRKCGVVDEDGTVILPFIFEESAHIDYYERGYVVTGTKGKRGLSTLDGSIILPEKYTDIVLKDEFIIASYRTEGNWNVRDELFLIDGTPIFDDLYRKVYVDGDKLTRETPFGLEHYRITHKK